MTTICFEVLSVTITHPFSVGILAVPNSLVNWSMHSGWPRTLSGGNSSFRRALTNDKEDITRDAARVTWLLRAGVGSSASKKKGFKLRTTGLSKLRYESYQNCSM